MLIHLRIIALKSEPCKHGKKLFFESGSDKRKWHSVRGHVYSQLKAETPLRLHVWPYVSGPTKKNLQRSIFFVAKSTASDRKRQVGSGGAHVVHGFFVIRACAKTCCSRGNAGRAAMFMKLRFRFSNSLC